MESNVRYMPARILFLALFLGTTAYLQWAVAQPIPMEAGWAVRQVVGGRFTAILGGLGADPVSTDLFLTGANAAQGNFLDNRVYRVTLTGIATAVHSELIDVDAYPFGPLAFDPESRMVYFVSGGNEPITLRKIDEFGALLENVTAPQWLGAIAFAPDGQLYATGALTGDILRYGESDDSFTVVHADVGSQLNGLCFDPQGNAYVSGDLQIRRIDPGGTVTTITSLSAAYATACGDGSVFTTDSSGNIWRVAPDGSGRTRFLSGQFGIVSLAFTSDRRLYIGEDNSESIWEFYYVPEPSTAFLMLVVLLALDGRRKRFRRCVENSKVQHRPASLPEMILHAPHDIHSHLS